MPPEPDNTPKLPPMDLTVEYGQRMPGSTNPMSEERRNAYQDRIRRVVEAEAAGAAKAAKLFVR